MLRPLLLSLTVWLPLADAAGVSQSPTEETLDEVQVRATRRLHELRQEITRLEDQIYARYNDLNEVDKFDVVCSDYTRTGTRLSLRYCRPVFEDQAKADEGQVAGLALQQIHDPYAKVPPASVQLPEPLEPKIKAQMPGYQRHMMRIIRNDPQLQRLLRERAAVAEQFRRTQRESFGR